jgi:hypothetical protein
MVGCAEGRIGRGLGILVGRAGESVGGVTFSSPVVMGRLIPAGIGIPLPVRWIIHLVVSVLYGMIISLLVTPFTRWQAVLVGGLVGMLLYFVNRAVVHFLFPALETNEAAVLFTHEVFAMVAAGAYRGLLKRRMVETGR